MSTTTSRELPPIFQNYQDAIDTTRINMDKEYRAQDIAYDAMGDMSSMQKLNLVSQALAYYPLSTEAWGVLGYYYLNLEDTISTCMAVEAFETALRVARKINPSWGADRTEPLEWGYIEHRPYLRAVQGLALAFHDMDQLDRAIETAELLVRWKYGGLDDYLCSWYLEAFRLDDAESFLSQHFSDEDRFVSCELGYSKFLLAYQKLQKGEINSSDLDQALVVALRANQFIPTCLMAKNPPSAKPEGFGTGSKEEAVKYVSNNWKLWRSIPGATAWLSFTMARCGEKPDEQTCVRLLRQHLLLIKLPDGTNILGTQCQKEMIGTALPDFHIHPAVSKPHKNGSPIPVQKHEFGLSFDEKWAEFKYEDIVSVPFWNVFLVCGPKKEDGELDDEDDKVVEVVKLLCGKCMVAETPQNLHKKCSRCSVVVYCSRECQVADWKKHKKECKRLRKGRFWGALDMGTLTIITSFLSLKERASVSGLNKAWLEAARAATSVNIDPDDVGINMNDVLTLVGSRFKNLRDVSIHIDQSYFLGNGMSSFYNKPTIQLDGQSLRQFFMQCPRLRSLKISFDDCCETHAQRILLEESGFDGLLTQTSLQNLELGCTYFEDVPSLALRLEPFINLRQLRLTWTRFNFRTAFSPREQWLSADTLMSVIGGMRCLRSLAINDHGLVDNDLRGLLPILGQLRALELEGRWGSNGFYSNDGQGPGFLTDAALEIIADHSPKLQSLNICFNRRITIKGIQRVVSACPLRQLLANEAGLSSVHLLEILRSTSTIRFVRFGDSIPGRGRHPQESRHLRDAFLASGGHVLFMSSEMHEPTFDPVLLRRHKAAFEALKQNKATASNGWNEWEKWI